MSEEKKEIEVRLDSEFIREVGREIGLTSDSKIGVAAGFPAGVIHRMLNGADVKLSTAAHIAYAIQRHIYEVIYVAGFPPEYNQYIKVDEPQPPEVVAKIIRKLSIADAKLVIEALNRMAEADEAIEKLKGDSSDTNNQPTTIHLSNPSPNHLKPTQHRTPADRTAAHAENH